MDFQFVQGYDATAKTFTMSCFDVFGVVPRYNVDGARSPKRTPNVVLPAVKEQILSDLDQLSPEEQRQAADLVHGLISKLPKGASVQDLLKLAGTLDDPSAREMKEAIEEGCERADIDEW